MYAWWHTLKNYLVIYWLFAKNCFMAQMEYRFNFYLGIGVEISYLIAKLLYVVVVYKTDLHIGSITPDGILLFVGTFTLMTGIYSGLFFYNSLKISEYVREGTLDLLLVKPISLQFLVTLRYIHFGTPIPNVIAGGVMIVIGWNALEIPVTFFHLFAYGLFLGVATILAYCLMFLPALLSFWFVNTGGLGMIFYSIWDANNMPMAIYSKWARRIGIYVLPFMVITNFGPLLIMQELRVDQLIWGLCVPIIMLVGFRMLWKRAISNYSSASG
ncbi:ABC-2 type transport system permease protein [Paenibacillus endophyticus]|uniref:ABC-2 type transport system permease protein n=1 Tax=Paenibacillus endophyticus TaxID=1294268 RepID=A0A7W5CCB8_9BACL|nr:ABC-2 family transporter protein [Paenibacillus endophyticus]MBB3154204.1 ABC-2 type transport system permease protein [Paenibacillus endophyticus]